MSWTPITQEEILELIAKAERQLTGGHSNFWEQIKIVPEKWNEESHGKEGNGFWVVAIHDRRAIYYNDIEEGFNISEFTAYGKLDEYFGNDDSLKWVVEDLFDLIRLGENGQMNRSIVSKQ